MPNKRIRQDSNTQTYFLTMTIERWYYIFDRYHRWEILADSMRSCQENKGLDLNGYVFMLNHIHMIASAPDIIGFIRDFKKFISKKLKENLMEYEPSVLPLFINDETQRYHFWQQSNAPTLIESKYFYWQKLNYIHNNPVRKGYVTQAEHWQWSSAHFQSPLLTRFWS